MEAELDCALELLHTSVAPALTSLAALARADAHAELLDARSFDFFDAALAHGSMSSECLKAAEVIIGTLARSASPREVICMVFEAFGKAPSPPLQLLLLRAVPTVLPRLTRKRAEFACTCLESLGARYLDDAWPGDGWDDEEEACSKDSKPASFHLLAALLESVAPLAPEAAAAVPSECGDAQSDRADASYRADAGAQRARQLLLGFLWRALELASNGGAERRALVARAHELLDAIEPRLAEVEAHLAPAAGPHATAPPAAGPHATAAPAADDGPSDEPASSALATWPALGMALYLSSAPCLEEVAPTTAPLGTGAAVTGAVVGAEAATATSAVASAVDRIGGDGVAASGESGDSPSARHDASGSPSARHDALLLALKAERSPSAALAFAAALAEPLLRSARHGAAALRLLDWAGRAVAPGSLACAEEGRRVELAVRALTTHMANSAQQSERTGGYKTLRRLLWAWAEPERFRLLKGLLSACPFPNVVALLIHRLKEEHLREAAESAPAVFTASAPPVFTASAPAVFTASALLELVEPLLAVPRAGEQTDPLDSLDALMGALNLVRLLLQRASAPNPTLHAALDRAAVVRLQRETLAHVDAWIRRRMDTLWAQVNAAERCAERCSPVPTTAPESLGQLRLDFTHLHVATDVAARTMEICKEFTAAAAAAAADVVHVD